MDEAQNPFLRNQVDAITRARALLGQKRPSKDYSISDLVAALAKAEERAQFMCGFVGLRDDRQYLAQLQGYLVAQNYVSVSGRDAMRLTEKGRERSSIPLPDQIESCL
jgi:hypothetical protein